MRRFILSLIAILTVPTSLLLGINWLRFGSWFGIDCKLDSSIHKIAVGASTISCAIDDEYIDGFRNLGRLGTPYSATLGPLKRFLESNSQIDTVYLAFGRYVVYGYPGLSEEMELSHLKDNAPFLLDNPDKTFLLHLFMKPGIYGALLNPDLIGFGQLEKHTPSDFGFSTCRAEEMYLHHPTAKGGIAKYDEQKKLHGGNFYDYKWLMDSCAQNIDMIGKAIDICRMYGAVPVMFCTPLYKYDQWFSMDGYYEYVRTLDKDLLIADYERFELPNDSMYYDVHHLNRRGAEYFTKEIVAKGIECTTIGKWLSKQKSEAIGFVKQN